MRYFLFALLVVASSAGAVVNPDAPDYVGEFHQRIETLRNRLDARSNTTYAMDHASQTIAAALDDELNAAYGKLMKRLPAQGQAALRTSQRQWLKYRDAELEFLRTSFTQELYGSSASLTAGSSYNSIVYDRAAQLWSYLENL